MSEDPMTTATAEMFLRQRDEAQAKLDEVSQERDRLREAIKSMARAVNERLDWIVRDRSEPDKVLANVSTTRSVLIRDVIAAQSQGVPVQGGGSE